MSEIQNLINKENTYILQAFLVVFLALIADLIQKKAFRRLAKKAEKTSKKWDDAILSSIPRPLSIIIWVSSIAFSAEIFQKETGAGFRRSQLPAKKTSFRLKKKLGPKSGKSWFFRPVTVLRADAEAD